METEEIRKEIVIGSGNLELAYDQWVALPVSGARPSARYKHAAAVIDEKLYVIGGIRNGRYLSDIQVFDLRSLAWSSLNLKSENADKLGNSSPQEVLPAISDHSVVKWENKLLLLGGHYKKPSDSMIVRFIDLETHFCGVVETSGKVPAARGGHSATLFGSRLIVFGGEDRNRRLMNDVHVLDLETMTWDVVEARQTPPAPRFDHTAAVHSERYLLIFGGCSHSVFFDDLHVLDLQSMEWSQPEIPVDLVTPRAGHAGCPETLVLNTTKLVLSILTRVKERDPLASEGLSVCSALIDGERHLVAFGGYNGKYNSEVFVMRLKPKDSSHPRIFQSPAAAAYALSEKLDFSNLNLNSKGVENGLSKQNTTIEIVALKEEKKAMELSLAEVGAENSRLSEKIDDVNSTHAELSKELLSVKAQLVTERSRCFKLEAQIAELQKILESMQSIENEVQLLRRQKSAFEQEMELGKAIQKQGSSGIWKWIAW